MFRTTVQDYFFQASFCPIFGIVSATDLSEFSQNEDSLVLDSQIDDQRIYSFVDGAFHL